MTEDIERPVSPRKVSESQLGEVPDEALHGVLQLESMTPRTLESFRKAERLAREPRLAGGRDGGAMLPDRGDGRAKTRRGNLFIHCYAV